MSSTALRRPVRDEDEILKLPYLDINVLLVYQ
jgi:hypothetical protein